MNDSDMRAELDHVAAAARNKLDQLIATARARLATSDENLAAGNLAEDLMHNRAVDLAAILAAAAIRLAKTQLSP